MPYFYTVLEVQVSDGVKAIVPPVIYDVLEDALAAYYTVCAVAVKSSCEYHSCHIIRSDGTMTEGRVFDRRQPEPEVSEEA